MPDRSTRPSPPRVTHREAALAENLASAAGVPVVVWGQNDPSDADAGWRAIDCFPADRNWSAESAQPESALLAKASLADRAVERPTSDGRRAVALRLGPRSALFAVGVVDQTAPVLQRLFEAAATTSRANATSAELREENDAFAAQLSADLEELTFLRSMVDQLSSVPASQELVGMARQTLPVLNETVRARCLAFLTVPNPDDPYNASVAITEGDSPLPHATLESLVRRFGPKASKRTVVHNWEAFGLPSDASVDPDDDRLPGVQSLVLTPLAAGPRPLGWLAAVNRVPSDEIVMESSWQLASDEFGSGEGTLLATTASILATHASNRDLLREKEQILVSVVRSLVSAIEAKDPYTRGHSERVALYTQRLAEEVGYTVPEGERIYLAALLHDVGKIGVSDSTLKKTGKLTDEEYAEISKHPDEGWAILCDLQQLRYVLPGVLHHHERWDGRGYPDGLAGDAIPLDGRVMAVADAYDAMTSDRPYRKGMPSEKAESILRGGAGVQWDPACVEAFFACLQDLHQIKADYKQRERRQRESERVSEEPLELPHEVVGVGE
ncbi:MAG: HD-GYP domain-containing protein [Planctomycetota bacterium]